MYTKRYKNRTQNNTQNNQIKCVLIKRLRQTAKLVGYTALTGVTYIVLIGVMV